MVFPHFWGSFPSICVFMRIHAYLDVSSIFTHSLKDTRGYTQIHTDTRAENTYPMLPAMEIKQGVWCPSIPGSIRVSLERAGVVHVSAA